MVRKIIKVASDVLSLNNDDIGDINRRPMKIKLKDDHPVQLSKTLSLEIYTIK